MARLALGSLVVFLLQSNAFAVTSSTYSSSGTVYITNTFTAAGSTENWTVPFGVSSIDAIAVGGGGSVHARA